jgi:tetratricopeptide (TPR) repeat protein
LVEEKPEVLAYHFTEAGEHARAIGSWERAGHYALRRQEGPEALGHLTRALELLPVLEGAEQRLHAELRISMPLGIAAMQVHGFRAPETERMYARIHELILQVGEALPRLDLSFWGPFSYYYVRAELHQVYELAQRLVDLGQRHGHRALWVLGCQMSATMLYAWGRPVEAMAYLERARASSEFTLEEHRALAVHHWIEPVAGVLAYGSLVYAMLGRMEESRNWAHEALTLARRIGHPHTTAYTQVIVALTCSLHQDAAETLKLAEQAIELSSERSFTVWLAWAELLRGWALSELGQPREGLVLVQRVLESFSNRHIRAGLPRDLSLLAEIHLKLGEHQEALAVVDEALVQSAATGGFNVDAWLHDLRGECLRRLGREEEAKRSFLRAIAVARQQGAGLFELRATVSLCRQLRDEGRGRVAWRLLSRACARFQAGGESVDLQKARVLLEALQAGGPGLAPQPSRT